MPQLVKELAAQRVQRRGVQAVGGAQQPARLIERARAQQANVLIVGGALLMVLHVCLQLLEPSVHELKVERHVVRVEVLRMSEHPHAQRGHGRARVEEQCCEVPIAFCIAGVELHRAREGLSRRWNFAD